MATQLREAMADMHLPAAARAVVRDGMDHRQAVEAVLAVDAGAALRLQARLLPRGYVLPWLCQCAAGETLADDDQEGLALAGRWMRDRDEPRRRQALAHAVTRAYVGMGALAAAAAGWAEGHLLDGEGRAVAPVPPALMPLMAAAALLTLAAGNDGHAFESRCRQYVAAALGLLRTEESA